MTDRNHHKKLREILLREDTIIFVGAGLSTWSGLPNWWQLLNQLCEELDNLGKSSDLTRRELNRNNLLQAASYGIMELTTPQFANFIRRAMKWGEAHPSRAHQLVSTLGPTCFITTNYDQLLEVALRQKRPAEPYQIVTNTQVSEVADIIQARAKTFVFKPHGDVGNCASIIFAREQYRALHGERRHVLDALSVLLVSRPVVFIGFGLQDPDFLYIKDILSLTYKGGTIDHYAVVPDSPTSEINWWRQHYGIEITSYETSLNADKSRNHSSFLSLLQDLNGPESRLQAPASPWNSSAVLAIARYAARLQQTFPPRSNDELPLRVSNSHRVESRSFIQLGEYDGWPVSKFLERNSDNAILLGAPGAGKTYAVRRYCTASAEALHSACLSEQDQAQLPIVPIYLDLKLYNGDLWQMATNVLPSGVDLTLLVSKRQISFFIDSYNEMPKEFIETGRFESDFLSFLRMSSSSTITLCSRTSAGLTQLGWPFLELDAIDRRYVEQFLETRSCKDRATLAVTQLLQKPFFFRLVERWTEQEFQSLTPHTIYERYFAELNSDLHQRFNMRIDLELLLMAAAFNAVEKGRETIPIYDLSANINAELGLVGFPPIADELINFLIGHDFLIAFPGSQVAFFHQSITEHLAGRKLAEMYRAAPSILDKCLQNRRWDQALFLALGHLDSTYSKKFIDRALELDASMAVRAAGFLEAGKSAVITTVLKSIVQREFTHFREESSIARTIEHLQVSVEHLPSIRRLIAKRNLLGGAGAALLASVLKQDAKQELLAALLSAPSDYNFLKRVADQTRAFIRADDMEELHSRYLTSLIALDSSNGALERKKEDHVSEAVAILLSDIPISAIATIFTGKSDEREFRVLIDSAKRSSDTNSFKVLADAVRRGTPGAPHSLYTALRFPRETRILEYALADGKLMSTLFDASSGAQFDRWAVKALRELGRIESGKELLEARPLASVFDKILILGCVTPESGYAHFAESLRTSISSLSESELYSLVFLFDEMPWSEYEHLLLQVMSLSTRICVACIEAISYLHYDQQFAIHIADLDIWIERLVSPATGTANETYWYQYRLGSFLATDTDRSTRDRIISKFNTGSRTTRQAIADFVLVNMSGLMPDELGSVQS